ncbi:MAG: LbtU family siderophore porin [Thermodesulfobacteriota bacterium]
MKKTIALAAMFALAGPASALAGSQEGLEAKVQELISQNRSLMERLVVVEKELAEQKEAGAKEKGAPAAGEKLLGSLGDRLAFSGLVEVEANAAKDFTKTKTSDITLATVELGLDATMNEWSKGHLQFLFEEDADGNRILVDEGTITLGNTEKFPFYMTAGKMYVPFGSYASNMISDPLTLELGETNESTVQFGFEANGFAGSVYAFNGDIDETGEDNAVRSYGASIGYSLKEENGPSFDLGLDWMSNLADTDAVQDYFAGLGTPITAVADFPAGLAVHGALQYGPWNVLAEYVAALDAFQATEMDFNGQGAEPSAFMAELAYGTEISGHEVTFALGYQQTDEALALSLPESRYLGAIRVGILDKTTLAFEYARDEDYDLAEGGTGEDGYSATVQLGYEF